MKQEVLENVAPFTELTDAQLAAIAETAELVECRKQDRIFTQNADATDLWIVVDGEVQLCCESSEAGAGMEGMTFLSTAQAFGWTCFVPPYKYQLSGYCASRRCRLIRLPKDELLGFCEKSPEVGFAIMQHTLCAVGTQFQELQDELAKQRGHEIMNRW
mgnify:CR=1 FL=1